MQLLCIIPHPRRHPRWENSCTSRTGLSWGVGGWRHIYIYTYVLYIWTDTHISYICFYQHHPQSLVTHTRSHPSCPASGNTADQVRPSKCPRLANHREEQRVGRSCRLHGQILFMKLLFRNNHRHQPRNVKYTITSILKFSEVMVIAQPLLTRTGLPVQDPCLQHQLHQGTCKTFFWMISLLAKWVQ